MPSEERPRKLGLRESLRYHIAYQRGLDPRQVHDVRGLPAGATEAEVRDYGMLLALAMQRASEQETFPSTGTPQRDAPGRDA